MAAPATHIILANKVFNKYFTEKDKKEFFVATSFPDIRYLGVIDREATHFQVTDITEIQSLPSFEAGLKFHSLIDKVRTEYMFSKGIDSFFTQSPYLNQAIKFFEDQIFYEKLHNWESVINYFNDVSKEEEIYCVKRLDLERWHKILQKYFSQKPNNQTIKDFVFAIGKPSEMADGIITLTTEMKDNKELVKIIKDFYASFEILVSKG